MPNLLTYLTDTQYETVYDRPLCDLDILALTELSYLPFDDLVPYAFQREQGIRLDKLAQAFLDKLPAQLSPLTMVTKERLDLLRLMASSRRFKYIKAFGYVNDYDKEKEKQFSAVTYALHYREFITIFRGTDDTLIGWKEDFHMAIMEEIPAQQAAKGYLTKLMTQEIGRYHIAGHSKGGNLALFATSQLPAAYQHGIVRICVFDAPGFQQQLLEKAHFQVLLPKLRSYLPQDSLVGMLFYMPEEAVIVKSTAWGLGQHVTFSWEVEQEDFVILDKRTKGSIESDQTLKRWLSNLSSEDIQSFTDALFGIFIDAGIERFSDILNNPGKKLQDIQRNISKIPTEQQTMMQGLIKQLFDIRKQVRSDNKRSLFPKQTTTDE